MLSGAGPVRRQVLSPASLLTLGVDADEVDFAERAPRVYSRKGYDPHFIAGHEVPLPVVVREPEKVQRLGENQETELRYHHYSVKMHGPRRLADPRSDTGNLPDSQGMFR